MQLYVDGLNDNDVGKFREAFHEDVWIFYVDADGKLTKNSSSATIRRVLDRFGDVKAMLHGVSVALWGASADSVHPADG